MFGLFNSKNKQSDPTIVWFEEVDKTDVALVGGKGANLGELTQAGLPVPPGFIVTAAAYREFLQTNKLVSKLKHLLSGINPEDTKTLQLRAKQIQELIFASLIPKQITEEISVAYRTLISRHPEGQYVAVRSSATAEDLPGASFAGQQATFLNVRGVDAVIHSVQKAWASLFEARAIFYRVQKGFDHNQVAIAIPIQIMVDADKAGVMFTLDPLTNNKSVVAIDAAYGLGETVVSGVITPDHFLVDKESLAIINKDIHRQTWRLVRSDTDTTGKDTNRHENVPEDLQEKPKLLDQEAIELAKLGITVENHYGAPQDIEWAISKGKIYLLQARPVTTMTRTVPVTNENREQRVESRKNIEQIINEQVSSIKYPVSSKQALDTKYSIPNTPSQPLLRGSGASLGVASGVVRIIHSPTELDRIKPGEVLVAEMTSPDYVPAMKRAAAIVTDTGGRTSHAAIVSRELGIPCVVGTGTATHTLKEGQLITVDGHSGLVFAGKQVSSIKYPVSSGRSLDTNYSILDTNFVPIGTKLYVNLADPDMADKVAAEPVDGVGLLRAEFMAAQIGEHPSAMEKQGRGGEFTQKLAEGLVKFARAFAPRPVIYRATDFKTNEYRKLKGGDTIEPHEENPMIGYRGAARYLAEPKLFRRELEAIIQVRREFDNLWFMIPFVRTVQELKDVLELVESSGLDRGPKFKVFMMCELPSNVILLNEFLDVGLDGVSIGSNDLTQLMLGVDRDNSQLAELFDERDEAVIKSIEYVIKTCRKRNVSVSICGQAPSFFPDFTEKLVEAGITSISVNPDVIVSTRQLIASIEKRLLLKSAIK